MYFLVLKASYIFKSILKILKFCYLKLTKNKFLFSLILNKLFVLIDDDTFLHSTCKYHLKLGFVWKYYSNDFDKHNTIYITKKLFV